MGCSQSSNRPKLSPEQCLQVMPVLPFSSIRQIARPRTTLKALAQVEASPISASWLFPLINLGKRVSNYEARWYQWKEWSADEEKTHFIFAHPGYWQYYQLLGGNVEMPSTLTEGSKKLKDAELGTLFQVRDSEDKSWWWTFDESEDLKEEDGKVIPPASLRRAIAVITQHIDHRFRESQIPEYGAICSQYNVPNLQLMISGNFNSISAEMKRLDSLFQDPELKNATLHLYRKIISAIISNDKVAVDKAGLSLVLPYMEEGSKKQAKVRILSKYGESGRFCLLGQATFCYLLGIPQTSNPTYIELYKLAEEALENPQQYQDKIYKRNLATLEHFKSQLANPNIKIDLSRKVAYWKGDDEYEPTLENILTFSPLDLIPVQDGEYVNFCVRDRYETLPYTWAVCQFAALEEFSKRCRLPKPAPFTFQIAWMSNKLFLERFLKKKESDSQQ